MWLAVWIVLLFVATAAGVDVRNLTRQSDADLVFDIDEVSTLNRKFLDFLLVFDEALVEDVQDARCVRTMRQLSLAYVNRELHGLEWFDSWGKIPSGMYYGNGFAIGNYEQCQRFRWDQIQGYHCTLLAQLPNVQLPVLTSGLCVPDLCTPEFMLQLYGTYLHGQGVTIVPVLHFCNLPQDVVYDGALVTAIVVFSIIAGLVLASTLYEVVQLYRQQPTNMAMTAFSLYRNIRSILHLTPRQKDAAKRIDMIECANGIRALSMIWIIFLHVHETSVSVPVNNPSARLDYLYSVASSVLAGPGSLAVDAFLAMGGMLVSMTLLRELDKQGGKINPLMLYLRRYIRLTTPYAAVILFVVSFAKYMGDGPMWTSSIDSLGRDCRQYWWSALLHIQNYVNPKDMCLNWTWYLSVDMQLYIIAPALIYPLWRWGKRVLIAIGGLAFLSVACVFTAILVNDFRDALVTEHLREQVLTYYPTHARMAVWLLGTIFGYILHSTKSTGVKLPKRYYAIGWSICFACLALIIYGSYEVFHLEYSKNARVADAFFLSLSRPVFGICVMWIIFASVNGHGGIIDRFLSSELWQPLAKLSFTMYLLHLLLLIMASEANVKTDLHFSVIDIYYRVWGAIGLTTSVALLWSAVFEIPFTTLERVLLRK